MEHETEQNKKESGTSGRGTLVRGGRQPHRQEEDGMHSQVPSMALQMDNGDVAGAEEVAVPGCGHLPQGGVQPEETQSVGQSRTEQPGAQPGIAKDRDQPGIVQGGKQSEETSEIQRKDSSQKRRRFPWKRKEPPLRVFIERKISEGFSGENLDFILTCIEEGMSQKEIDEVASPKLPVEVMQRLKELNQRKGEAKNG